MTSYYNQGMLKRDAQNNVIQESYLNDMTMRAEYSAGNLIYIGYARPGAAEGDDVWQIAKLAYSGSDPTSKKWPQNAAGIPTSEFQYNWTGRAGYTYS